MSAHQHFDNPIRGGRKSAVVFISLTLAIFGLVLFLPLITVFFEAFRQGLDLYTASLTEPDAVAAIQLTLLITAIVVPLNTLFGVASAWAITKFDFKGKSLLLSLIDLPFSISPVIAGLVYVLLFGAAGWFAPVLDQTGVQILFAWPGIVLATVFVTFPFVAREVIPLMQAQGSDEEAAATTLGANGWKTFWSVTLPNIKWALMYGVLLCAARATDARSLRVTPEPGRRVASMMSATRTSKNSSRFELTIVM